VEPDSDVSTATQAQSSSEAEEKKVPKGKDLIPEAEPEPEPELVSPPEFEGILAAKEDLNAHRDQTRRPAEPSPTPERKPLGGEGEKAPSLSKGEQDLLGEIMDEIAPSGETGFQKAEQQGESPGRAAGRAGKASDEMPAALRAAPAGKPSPSGAPTIPQAKDGKSEQEAIDDILKEIKGLIP